MRQRGQLWVATIPKKQSAHAATLGEKTLWRMPKRTTTRSICPSNERHATVALECEDGAC